MKVLRIARNAASSEIEKHSVRLRRTIRGSKREVTPKPKVETNRESATVHSSRNSQKPTEAAETGESAVNESSSRAAVSAEKQNQQKEQNEERKTKFKKVEWEKKGAEKSSAKTSENVRKSAVTTVTLLTLTFYFAVTTLPVSFMVPLYLIIPPGPTDVRPERLWENEQWARRLRYITVKTFVDDIGLSHYASGIIIYLVTNRPFRNMTVKCLARWFPCLFRKLDNQNRLQRSQANGSQYSAVSRQTRL